MISTYLDTLAPFVPACGAEVSEESQRQLHGFMEGTYRTLRDDPGMLFAELHPDDAHPNRFNKSSYGKPRLVGDMRKVLKTVDAFLGTLFALGGEGKPADGSLVFGSPPPAPKKHRALMAALGLQIDAASLRHPQFPEMAEAWHWMAARPDASLLAFSRCLFDPEYAYTSAIFRRLAGDEAAFDRLEGYLLSNGYLRLDCCEGQISLDYVRCHGDPAGPVGNYLYGHHYAGVHAHYDPLVQTPQCFGIRILGMRELLPQFGAMDGKLQDFVVAHTKHCDGCDYCIQRNKGRPGQPQRYDIVVEHRGERRALCPLFPGYSYCWSSLNQDRVDGIIAFLGFMERHFDAVGG